MQLPFTGKEFLDVFESYNLSVFPAQIILNLLAILVIFLAIKQLPYKNRLIGLFLGILWLWNGLIYHLLFFSQINKLALFFAALFVIQGILFCYLIAIKGGVQFSARLNFNGILGSILMSYALILYPVLGTYFGHSYPHNPTFGLPCPTTIFTFGLLLWAEKKVPVYLLIIPFLWSLMGFSAAIKLGIIEDIGLLVSGVIGSITLLYSGKRKIMQIESVKNAN